MRGAKTVAVPAFLLLLVMGCARTSAGPEEETLCPPEVRTATATPSGDVGLTSQIWLGSLKCADPETGMSLIEVSVLNPHATRAAWYEVTLQFTTSEGAVFATETAYLGRAEPGKRAEREMAVARPVTGDGIGVRVLRLEQGLFDAPSVAPQPSPPATAMDVLVRALVQAGAIPPTTPYGACPSGSPQGYWLDEPGNCRVTPGRGPSVSAVTPAPMYPGTLCGDGWASRSNGRGTCSHHGGIAR